MSHPGPPPTTHPYGARISLLFGSDVQIELPPEGAQSQQADGTILTLAPAHTSPREKSTNLTRVLLKADGFGSATEAEAFGLRAATAILWAAVSKKFGLRVEYAGPLPVTVYERNRRTGLSGHAEGQVFWPLNPEVIFGLVQEAIGKTLNDKGLLNSLEFFAASQLESTALARFVMIVTALEALATQQEYGNGIPLLLSELVEQIRSSTHIDDEKVRESLIGRTRELKRESVRQAILRTVNTHLGDDKAVAFVDRAYTARSAVLHTGVKIPDIESMVAELEGVMRRIYQAVFGLDLQTPPPELPNTR